MAPIKNGRLLYKEIPDGYPQPGKHVVYDESELIDLDNVPLNGGLLLKILVLSIDPYLRNRMRDPSVRGFLPAFEIGKPLQNGGVAQVLRSEDPKYTAGTYVAGSYPFQKYLVAQASEVNGLRPVQKKGKLTLSAHVGVAGMPGATAYTGWKEYAKPKAGEVVFVTTGAGCVGAIVIQLAKADGLKVIGSAGSDAKVEYMKSMGADVVFNYKKTKVEDVLKKEGPIDIFWDNVGGEALDAALANCNKHARFIECGMMSVYNGDNAYQMKNLNYIYQFEIQLHGFIILSLIPKYPEFYTEFANRIASGEIKYNEDITVGLENGGAALETIQRGNNTGKSVIAVADY
ncbi:hypothetical protein EIP91_003417 [Steccherinum ochraceum]|uniref:Enoyl reductase (ER) domain-containing protein n=1 Tax=Steccherinum ochraceum TaxID=92696 RepID=A0A4R0RJ22_9APHY|nr:hypothetical protein EIP91_003417 [Steccherinum ochraceum]